MSDTEFDTALVTAAFRMAGEDGWRTVNVAGAAREAGMSLVEARERFPSRDAILLRFGRLADQAALADASSQGSVRDKLFDLLMRRFDVLQTHRTGVKALLRFVPSHPRTGLLLACATRRSMRWMLQAAGVSATGPRGGLEVRGLMAVWLWTVRAWERDESEDLSGTMAALDNALQRAEQLASWLRGARSPTSSPSPVPERAGELDPFGPGAVQDPPAAEDPPLVKDPPPIDDPPIEDPPIPEAGG
jgi:ubiquinone biosynthesis protein COQ9